MTANLTRIMKGAVVAIVLLFSTSVLVSTALAQGRSPWGIRGGLVRTQARVFVRPRVRVFAFPRVYAYPRAYYYAPGYPYYNRYDAGPFDVAYQNGYHDGFDRGREDVREGKGYDPNHSSHFRDSISSAYRDGFVNGYREGYRRYAG